MVVRFNGSLFSHKFEMTTNTTSRSTEGWASIFNAVNQIAYAVQHKLKNGQKTQKKHFLTVFEPMSDSVTAI